LSRPEVPTFFGLPPPFRKKNTHRPLFRKKYTPTPVLEINNVTQEFQTFSVSGALTSLVFCHGALVEICVHSCSTKCCTLYNVQGLCFTTRLLHNIVIVAKHERCTFVQHFIEHDCDCILTLVTRHRNENNHNLRLT
jgi:hypothetical protein